ncbi:MAG: helix-turn-helix domain-containing protein [Planctomycetota bacterium]
MKVECFQDFDEFAASIRNIESRMMFRNPDRRTWRLASVDVGRMILQHGQLGSGNIAQGQIQTDGYMLYLPLTPATEYTANGATLEEESFAILEPGSEFCISTKVAHDWGVVFVPIDIFAPAGECVWPAPSVETKTVRVTRALPHAAARFRAVLRDVMATAATRPRFESSPAARGAAAELLDIASSVLGLRRVAEPHARGRVKYPREDIVRRCHELLDQRDAWPVHVGALAAAAGVSERTLRTVFHEYFGVGPLRYLHLRQLYQVHRALQAAEPDAASVSEILVDNGVWEFGRFACRYDRHFGEPPSATLRAGCPCPS